MVMMTVTVMLMIMIDNKMFIDPHHHTHALDCNWRNGAGGAAVVAAKY